MSNNRYVILNCPTLMGNRLCYSKEIKQCADCTDCVMKQIYDLCNKYKEHDIIALQITKLLQIEECE